MPREELVRANRDDADDRATEQLVGLGNQDEPARDERRPDDDDQRGNDPPDPPFPKMDQRESARIQVVEHQARDQVARDHEEDVDTDVAPRQAESRMVEHHGDNRQGAQTVDIGPIFHAAVLRVGRCRRSHAWASFEQLILEHLLGAAKG